MEPKKYRKKPVVIDAMQYLGKNAAVVAKWCGGEVTTDRVDEDDDDVTQYVRIETLEGAMLAAPGDYVIKGVKGEFYPCKPDIFAATYEEVK
jgi:hypothetical protein